jgi:hypothetical protein
VKNDFVKISSSFLLYHAYFLTISGLTRKSEPGLLRDGYLSVALNDALGNEQVAERIFRLFVFHPHRGGLPAVRSGGQGGHDLKRGVQADGRAPDVRHKRYAAGLGERGNPHASVMPPQQQISGCTISIAAPR